MSRTLIAEHFIIDGCRTTHMHDSMRILTDMMHKCGEPACAGNPILVTSIATGPVPGNIPSQKYNTAGRYLPHMRNIFQLVQQLQ